MLIAMLTSLMDLTAIVIIGNFLSILTVGKSIDLLNKIYTENYLFLALVFFMATLIRLYLNYLVIWFGQISEGRLSTKLLESALQSDLNYFEKDLAQT